MKDDTGKHEMLSFRWLRLESEVCPRGLKEALESWEWALNSTAGNPSPTALRNGAWSQEGFRVFGKLMDI